MERHIGVSALSVVATVLAGCVSVSAFEREEGLEGGSLEAHTFSLRADGLGHVARISLSADQTVSLRVESDRNCAAALVPSGGQAMIDGPFSVSIGPGDEAAITIRSQGEDLTGHTEAFVLWQCVAGVLSLHSQAPFEASALTSPEPVVSRNVAASGGSTPGLAPGFSIEVPFERHAVVLAVAFSEFESPSIRAASVTEDTFGIFGPGEPTSGSPRTEAGVSPFGGVGFRPLPPTEVQPGTRLVRSQESMGIEYDVTHSVSYVEFMSLSNH